MHYGFALKGEEDGRLLQSTTPERSREARQRDDLADAEEHVLKRVRPTCTERISITKDCGWKGGDRGRLAEREKNSLKEE